MSCKSNNCKFHCNNYYKASLTLTNDITNALQQGVHRPTSSSASSQADTCNDSQKERLRSLAHLIKHCHCLVHQTPQTPSDSQSGSKEAATPKGCANYDDEDEEDEAEDDYDDRAEAPL
jgi:hypothetical protein